MKRIMPRKPSRRLRMKQPERVKAVCRVIRHTKLQERIYR